MPMFSIIVVHYQGTIPHEIFLRGIGSILNQTCKDYEILCYHDGPLLDTSVQFPVPVKTTAIRFNDWGHSLRDLGIREAKGDYIVHFNADNVLYPHALEEVRKAQQRPSKIFSNGAAMDTDDMIIFPIKLMGMITFRGASVRIKGETEFTICVAHPPVLYNIDCMQLVMKRTLWLAEGGWYDKTEKGDGIMYERFARKYGYRTVSDVLGEHH